MQTYSTLAHHSWKFWSSALLSWDSLHFSLILASCLGICRLNIEQGPVPLLGILIFLEYFLFDFLGLGEMFIYRSFRFLELVGIQLDHLPPFQYSLDSPNHLLPIIQELKKIFREYIYRKFFKVTSVNPLWGTLQKMAFNIDHFFELIDRLIFLC